MHKIDFIHAAEIFDSWRVAPRALLFGYGIWVSHITYKILEWYMHLPSAERSLETTGLAGVIITTITGLLTIIFKTYSSTGRDWNNNPGSIANMNQPGGQQP